MEILVNDERRIDDKTMELLREAAFMCVTMEKEERGCDNLSIDALEISLSFVSLEEIQDINREYRGVDSPTDVLSFPMFESIEEMEQEGEVLPIGDVVICMDKIRSQAEELGHSLERETAYLFVHSMLHLMGYDHMEEEQKKEMRRQEEKIMKELDLTR